MRRLLFCLFVLCSSLRADLSDQIDPLFSPYNKPNVPGAAVLVVRDGEIVFEKGYGLRDVEAKDRVSETSNFRLASLTKQFTAMSIALLIADGKLSLDETLKDVFSDFPDYGKKVKISHLLHHTSGLPSYEEMIPGSQTEQVLDSDVLRLMKQAKGTNFTPGSRYSYSNSGYCVLAQVVEKRSGQRFASFVKDRIFNPLWMRNSNVFEKPGEAIPERAYGYTASNNGFRRTDQSLTSATQGDGGVYTSAHELFFWDQALESGQLLPPPIHQLLFAPGKLNDGSNVNYGFGWEIGSYRGLKCFSHTGSTIGFRTAIQRYPEKRFTVAVLINRANSSPWDIARAIVDKLLF